MAAESNNQLTPELLSAAMVAAMQVNHPDNKQTAHNQTVATMKQLHDKQRNGEHDMIAANLDPTYQIKACDAHFLHAVIEKPEFDQNTGKRLSRPMTQTFAVDDFVRMADNTSKNSENAFAGKTVKIIHDPRQKRAENTATAQAAAGPAPTTTPKPEKVLSAATIDTYSPKDLRIIYKNMMGKEPGNISAGDMRTEIVAKLAEIAKNDTPNITSGSGEQTDI